LAAKPKYIAVEGPEGVGKTAVAKRLAHALGARTLLENADDNPFLEAFYRDTHKVAFQAQVFFLLSRHQLLQSLAQPDLFSGGTVADFLFERERVFAALCLNPDERALYDRIHHVVRDRVPKPDLVIYLQSRPEALSVRLRAQPGQTRRPRPWELEELVRTYNDFFFHYNSTPLLVVNASDVDLTTDDEELGHLSQQVQRHRKGAWHYHPLARR
jgi:deoxyadenosine/deoxycytidine kinase